MKQRILAVIFAFVVAGVGSAQIPVYLDNSKTIDERVEDALSRMTIEEKVAMTHARTRFSSPGVARLGIPEFWMTDGSDMVTVIAGMVDKNGVVKRLNNSHIYLILRMKVVL